MLCFPSALKVYDRVWCKTNWNWIHLAKILSGLLWSWDCERSSSLLTSEPIWEITINQNATQKTMPRQPEKHTCALFSEVNISGPELQLNDSCELALLLQQPQHERDSHLRGESMCVFSWAVFLFIHLDFSKWCACVLYFKWQIN